MSDIAYDEGPAPEAEDHSGSGEHVEGADGTEEGAVYDLLSNTPLDYDAVHPSDGKDDSDAMASGAVSIPMTILVQSLSTKAPVGMVAEESADHPSGVYVFSASQKYRLVLEVDLGDIQCQGNRFAGELGLSLDFTHTTRKRAGEDDTNWEYFLSRVETLIEQDSKDSEAPDLKNYLHVNNFANVPVTLSDGKVRIVTRIWPCLFTGTKRRTKQEDHENIQYTLNFHAKVPGETYSVFSTNTIQVCVVPKSSYYKRKQKKAKAKPEKKTKPKTGGGVKRNRADRDDDDSDTPPPSSGRPLIHFTASASRRTDHQREKDEPPAKRQAKSNSLNGAFGPGSTGPIAATGAGASVVGSARATNEPVAKRESGSGQAPGRTGAIAAGAASARSNLGSGSGSGAGSLAKSGPKSASSAKSKARVAGPKKGVVAPRKKRRGRGRDDDDDDYEESDSDSGEDEDMEEEEEDDAPMPEQRGRKPRASGSGSGSAAAHGNAGADSGAADDSAEFDAPAPRPTTARKQHAETAQSQGANPRPRVPGRGGRVVHSRRGRGGLSMAAVAAAVQQPNSPSAAALAMQFGGLSPQSLPTSPMQLYSMGIMPMSLGLQGMSGMSGMPGMAGTLSMLGGPSPGSHLRSLNPISPMSPSLPLYSPTPNSPFGNSMLQTGPLTPVPHTPGDMLEPDTPGIAGAGARDTKDTNGAGSGRNTTVLSPVNPGNFLPQTPNMVTPVPVSPLGNVSSPGFSSLRLGQMGVQMGALMAMMNMGMAGMANLGQAGSGSGSQPGVGDADDAHSALDNATQSPYPQVPLTLLPQTPSTPLPATPLQP